MTTTSTDWAVQMLDETVAVDAILRILRQSVRASVNADGATVVLLDHDQCYYADEDAMSPLWKGQRFPVSACISGWAMLHRRSVVVPDITVDDRIPQEAYRPTFVRSLVMVPMRVADPLGAIGAYWARPYAADESEVTTLEQIAEAAGTALSRTVVPPRTQQVE
jgi:GAF domain-containing protein